MRSSFRLLLVLAAVSMTTACSSSAPRVTGQQLQLSAPVPAAAMQLCPVPPQLSSGEVDEVAAALMDMYGMYGQCAALHADLVHYLEERR